MTGKKWTTLLLGGLMALNIAWAVAPGAGTAEAAPHRQEVGSHSDRALHRALRDEDERHEHRIHEIRQRYHSHSKASKREHELRRERDRHERAVRDIYHRYGHRGAR